MHANSHMFTKEAKENAGKGQKNRVKSRMAGACKKDLVLPAGTSRCTLWPIKICCQQKRWTEERIVISMRVGTVPRWDWPHLVGAGGNQKSHFPTSIPVAIKTKAKSITIRGEKPGGRATDISLVRCVICDVVSGTA